MTASLDTLVIAAYVFATTLSIRRTGPEGTVSDHEWIAPAGRQEIVSGAEHRYQQQVEVGEHRGPLGSTARISTAPTRFKCGVLRRQAAAVGTGTIGARSVARGLTP